MIQLDEAQIQMLQKVINHIDRLLAKWQSPSNPNQSSAEASVLQPPTEAMKDVHDVDDVHNPEICTDAVKDVADFPNLIKDEGFQNELEGVESEQVDEASPDLRFTSPDLQFSNHPTHKPDGFIGTDNDVAEVSNLKEVVAFENEPMEVDSRTVVIVKSVSNGSIYSARISCLKEPYESLWKPLELRYRIPTKYVNILFFGNTKIVDTGWNTAASLHAYTYLHCIEIERSTSKGAGCRAYSLADDSNNSSTKDLFGSISSMWTLMTKKDGDDEKHHEWGVLESGHSHYNYLKGSPCNGEVELTGVDFIKDKFSQLLLGEDISGVCHMIWPPSRYSTNLHTSHEIQYPSDGDNSSRCADSLQGFLDFPALLDESQLENTCNVDLAKQNELKEWADHLVSDDDALITNWSDLLVDATVENLEPEIACQEPKHNVAGEKNQGEYKYTSEDYFDAALTPLGWQQVDNLEKHVQGCGFTKKVQFVMVFHLTRSMHTTVSVFGSGDCADGVDVPPLMSVNARDSGRAAISSLDSPPLLSVELCHEILGVHQCDRRGSVTQYKYMFPAIDFSPNDNNEDVLRTTYIRGKNEEIDSGKVEFLGQILRSRSPSMLKSQKVGYGLDKVVKVCPRRTVEACILGETVSQGKIQKTLKTSDNLDGVPLNMMQRKRGRPHASKLESETIEPDVAIVTMVLDESLTLLKFRSNDSDVIQVTTMRCKCGRPSKLKTKSDIIESDVGIISKNVFDSMCDRNVAGNSTSKIEHCACFVELKDLKKYSHVVRVKVLVTNSTALALNSDFCFHMNVSLGLGICHQEKWKKPHKDLWVGYIFHFDHKIIDLRMANSSLGTVEMSIVEGLFLYRVILMIRGLVLTASTSYMSKSILFYYISTMTAGVLLVILVAPGMKLLPTMIIEIGIREDMYGPLFLTTLVLAIVEAWLSFWIVRKMVSTDEGSIEVSTSHYVEFGIRVWAVRKILQSSLNPIMAGGPPLLGTNFLPLMQKVSKLKYLHNPCGMRLFNGRYKYVREAYKPEDVFEMYASKPQSRNKRNQNEYGKGTKDLTGSPWSSSITGSWSKPSESDTFYSTFPFNWLFENIPKILSANIRLLILEDKDVGGGEVLLQDYDEHYFDHRELMSKIVFLSLNLSNVGSSIGSSMLFGFVIWIGYVTRHPATAVDNE